MKYLIAAFVTLLIASSSAFSDGPQTNHTRIKRQFSLGSIPIVLTNNGLTTLVDLVVKAGLAEALSGPGPFTVFAPINNAFTTVDPSILNAILSDITALRKVIAYHVVESTLPAALFKNELTPLSASGENLRVNVYDSGDAKTVTINGALKIRTLEATNGVIHVINKVLIPEPKSNIIEVLEKKGNFTTLLTALAVAGLTTTIQNAGPFTLFAPTDDAFRSLPAGTLDSLITNREELKKVLLSHVASGTLYKRGLSSGLVPVIAGGNVKAAVGFNGAMFGNAQMIETDLFASNGVIHVINSVILHSVGQTPKVVFNQPSKAVDNQPTKPPVNQQKTRVARTIASILNENGLTTLADLLVKAGLVNVLSQQGPFTLFAPTNDAFNAVDSVTLNALLQDVNLLKRVLTYHVVPSAIPPVSIKNELVTNSLAGESLRINEYNNRKVVTINGALRLKALEAENGIVYVIDKVLIPDNNKSIIVKVLETKGKFTTLMTALVVSGLKNHLDSAGPFTLFAPSDDAFKALPAGVLNSLFTNPSELKKVLLSHVIPTTVYSRGLSSGHLNLARGGKVAVTVSQSGVKISNANIIEADLAAANGVIHVINNLI
ncbi:LOW QUALITY PROTEIN: transforming growth factor-beta-induced protein ig-h3 [Daphnia magna]|uniref:LOW QUALITY PROTEIN: transforming growth factor-beta-induced protein ig-h3 n=1 Tax=Daphnia magna TaxID=35525 RepID=UPI001E1BAAAC|nr:LOW QUALITY PROTEIN: transforming growth factor-beta-induced protein ig-h3 [Daphnia magna]